MGPISWSHNYCQRKPHTGAIASVRETIRELSHCEFSELAYALDTLQADEVILLGNYAEKYLGDAAFEPLWAEVDRRQPVVFVHPALPLPPAAGVADPLVDNPFDTTRTAVQFVLNGMVDRYPEARIILAAVAGSARITGTLLSSLTAQTRSSARKS